MLIARGGKARSGPTAGEGGGTRIMGEAMAVILLVLTQIFGL